MNPWSTVCNFYGDTVAKYGMDAAAALVCRLMADAYVPGTMPAGSNPWAWCLAQLERIRAERPANRDGPRLEHTG